MCKRCGEHSHAGKWWKVELEWTDELFRVDSEVEERGWCVE